MFFVACNPPSCPIDRQRGKNDFNVTYRCQPIPSIVGGATRLLTRRYTVLQNSSPVDICHRTNVSVSPYLEEPA